MIRRFLALGALSLAVAACGSSTHPRSAAAPAIEIDSPAAGATVTSPLHVSGTANTFEARFTVELDAHGRVLARKDVMASSGSGTRGTYSLRIPFSVTEPTSAELVAYELSARNGERINSVSVPIQLAP